MREGKQAGRLRRPRRAMLALLAATAFTGAPARAQDMPAQAADEPDFSSDNPVARWLLPYAPVFFDFIVQGGRSFAEVTYDGRSYDPVTQNFVVSGLHVRRLPEVDVSIARMRVGLDTTLLQGVAVNTVGLDIPPPLREGLRRLKRETVTGDIVVGLRADLRRAAYDLDMQLDFPEIGSFSVAAVVDGFHVLVPLSGVAEDGISEPPQVLGTLRKFSLSYRDLGLMDAATAIVAEQQGVSPDQLTSSMATLPEMTLNGILADLPGGASPGLQDEARKWARAVEAFVKSKGSIELTLDPAEPIPLSRFEEGSIDETLIAALNPTVVSPAETESGPKLADLSGDALGAAQALLAGRGVLQDREGAAATLIGLAGNGDEGALRALATGFGAAPAPDLSSGELAALYEYLLVGRALGFSVTDDALNRLTARLSPMALRGAELAAADYFRTRTALGQAAPVLSAETIVDFSPAAIRAMAFDAYEGNKAPRDFTRAYALALVAAAGGDRLAQSLRDDLLAAASENRVVLSAEEAHMQASQLWAAYAARAAQPAAPEAQEAPDDVNAEPAEPEAVAPEPAPEPEQPAPEPEPAPEASSPATPTPTPTPTPQ